MALVLVFVFVILVVMMWTVIRWLIARRAKASNSERKASNNELTGSVESFQSEVVSRQKKIWVNAQRVLSSEQHVTWRFRVVRYDANGDKIHPPIEVQMQGKQIDGRVANGDNLRLTGWVPGQVLKTDRLFNETTQTPVIART